MTNNTGGYVFPGNADQGITRRDWLAGLAMQGLCAAPKVKGSNSEIAFACYAMADAMIAESERRTSSKKR